ncbi:MAG TPA: hypothetical protein VMH28_20985 [Candidatus Acidoferrales bacterium]|nr:hypothetical protein [Candidatus Acidoferrales bacterium]
MSFLLDYPLIFLLVSFMLLWVSAQTGGWLRRRRRHVDEAEHEDLGTIQGAALTLLALIIGFTFSMAVGRYDQRKNFEEAEANAIGTEYVRADLLPAADAARVRQLLKNYLEQRIMFYTTGHDTGLLDRVNAATGRLQTDLWSAVQAPAGAQPTPVAALAISGMNDVLNSQGYTQAAIWNRIPTAAWVLMLVIGVACNLLVGYNARQEHAKPRWFFLLPAIVAVSFFLIADMDSPRGGVILVAPQNLVSLSQSLRGQ